MTSIMPEPQIPVILSSFVESLKPASVDHSSDPITLNFGSKVSRSILTRSIAPAVARCPALISPPSKAGPVGLEHTRSRSLLPSTISALVPTSTMRLIASSLSGLSARMTPAVSAPTWPAIHGKTNRRAWLCVSSPKSRALSVTASSTVNAKGAPPKLMGLMPKTKWCMIGLATSEISKILSVISPS